MTEQITEYLDTGSREAFPSQYGRVTNGMWLKLESARIGFLTHIVPKFAGSAHKALFAGQKG